MRGSEVFLIASKELRELLRDRRALFFAFVLPLLIHPALFFGFGQLEELRLKAAAGRASRIGLFGAPAELREIWALDTELELMDGLADPSGVERGEVDALVVWAEPATGDELPKATVYYEGGRPGSEVALERIERALAAFRDRLLGQRLAELGSRINPSALLPHVPKDLAAPRERSGASLGRLLPLILVALLLTGGSFAALDLVAGEKERGTLETLFVQPVAAGSVVLGKFLAVLAASLAAVVLNLVGMAGALAAGLGPLGPGSQPALAPSLPAMAAALVLLLPLAVLSSAVLLAVSTHARSFREAQLFVVPVTLVAMLPALLAALPDIRLSPAVAAIPVAGTALALREALAGDFRLLGMASAFATTAVYAGLALAWAARLLEREDLRLGLSEPGIGAFAGRSRAARGLAFGAAMVLFVAYAGTWAQHPDGPLGPQAGLAFTLWVLVLLPPLIYLYAFRLPAKETLALRAPLLRHVLAAMVLVAPATVLILAYGGFQDTVLPAPEAFRIRFTEVFGPQIHPLMVFFLIAVSPAICEEVLWRGVVQGELEADGRPVKTVLTVGVLFGLFHLDVYRLVPTALLGILLAYLRLTTGSLAPCVVFHCLYNATAFFAMRLFGESIEAPVPAWALVLAALVAGGILSWLWLDRSKRRTA